MDTKQLREITTEQLQTVNNLPEETHIWDVYLGIQESIMVIQVGESILALQSKKTVCANIKHNGYFHLTSNFRSIHSYGKRLYGHMFDMVDTYCL